jgi:hypothetical protein
MLEDLPEDVRAGLAAAARRQSRGRSRYRVHVGGEILPVRRLWEDGFSLGREHARALRGLVDLFDGTRHVSQCLIVASAPEGDEVICEFKRNTAAHARAPLDFARDEDAPAGLLAKQ